MEKLTQEEFEYLKQYEDRLITATNSTYARALSSGAVHRMREIYSRLIGETYSMNEACGSCILTLCRKLYQPYNDYKQEIERNSTRCTTKVNSDSTKISGGEIKTGDSKRTTKKIRSKSDNS